MHATLCQAAWFADQSLSAGDANTPALGQLLKYADEIDRPTDGHVHRVADLASVLALSAGWSSEDATTLRTAAFLHDIGKAGIPRDLLEVARALEPPERRRVELHTVLGGAIFARCRSTVLRTACMVAHSHHEKWDGSGYPQRLNGAAIPEAARIVAIADVYDALVSNRPYRPGWSHSRTLAYISDNAGTHFDPRLADLFLAGQRETACA
jgi:putative two-component system response regulator